MFLISLSLLTLSVLHDVNAESIIDEGEELDFVCPPGMSWCVTMARCMAEKGYSCCPTCSHEYKCSKSERERKEEVLLLVGDPALLLQAKLQARLGVVGVGAKMRQGRH